MSTIKKLAFISYFITLLFTQPVFAWLDPWPEMERPPGIQFEWIAKDIQHNGIDMKIMRIYGSLPAEKTLQFYTTAWTSENIEPRSFGTQDHLVLSRVIKTKTGEYQFTLELPADQKKTKGVLSLMRLDEARDHPAAKLNPFLPSGVKLVSDTLSIDAEILNRTLVAQHTNSVMHHEFRFKQIFEAKGWSVENSLSEQSTTRDITQKERLLRFFKNKDELTLSLIPNDGTKIVAVYLRKP